jgi:M6 family metalloprotease-like protein
MPSLIRRRQPSVLRTALAVLTVVLTMALTTAMDYPTPPPDFGHPNAPHYSWYQPVNGATSRPMLVIRGGFTDLPWPAVKDEAWLDRRFFGTERPSVREYFARTSFGRADLTRAREASGTPDDGIVTVGYGLSSDAWDALPDEQKMRHALNTADPLVDYSVFDRDGDHVLDVDEVLIVVLQSVPFDSGDTTGGCGATRSVHAGSALDGMEVGHRPVIWAQSAVNLITLDHEVMHAAFGMNRDWYQYDIDGFDIMGGTCGSEEFFVDVNAWHKMHLGWAAPTVVTQDGYYTVPAWDSSGRSFLLYDPSRGTDDYFLVENRQRRPGGNDSDVADNGLVVWRVDESRYHVDDAGAYPVRLIGPCPDAACPWRAWDPSDPDTPQQDMTAPWRDGTPSAVSIHSISEAGPNMTAYFDVPGPGALVNCFDGQAEGHRRGAEVIAGQTVAVDLPVRNTAEVAGAVGLGLAEDPGPGWTWSAQPVELGAKETGLGTLRISAPADAAPGTYRLWPKATWLADPQHGSRCDITVRVTAPPAPAWGYASTRAAQYDAPLGVRTTLDTSWQWGTWKRSADQEVAAGNVTMIRTGTGRYTVTMPELGRVPGVAHAAAGVSWGYTDAASCQLVSTAAQGVDKVLEVACSDGTGAARNLPFAVWASGHSAGQKRQLQARYQTIGGFADAVPLVNAETYNSTAGSVEVRRVGEGRYEVTAEGAEFDASGHVRVTPLRSEPARCRAVRVEDTGDGLRIVVACSGAAWTPVSTPWLLTYTEGVGVHHDAAVPAAYASTTGDPAQPVIDTGRSWSTGGEIPTVTRTAPGVYDVNYQDVGNPYTYPADLVDVTALGSAERSCRPLSWNSYSYPRKLRVIVHCYDAAHRLADAHFALAYLRAPTRDAAARR